MMPTMPRFTWGDSNSLLHVCAAQDLLTEPFLQPTSLKKGVTIINASPSGDKCLFLRPSTMSRP